MTSDHPLLVTRDEALLDDLLRLAAAAGAVLDVAHDSGAARTGWATAPVVLVGADAVASLAATSPLRRERVHVVGHGPAPDDLYRAALAVGADTVAELPAAETWLVETLTDVVDGTSGRAVTLAVVGGSGGAGATTFAAALARTAASASRPATLVDADPLGGGIERVIGLDAPDGVGWGSLRGSTGRFGSRSLRAALPQVDGLAVLGWGASPRGGLDPGVVREVVSALQRGNETVVLDVPRYPDAATGEVLTRCDHVLVVTTLTLPGVAASGLAAAAVAPYARQVHLVARRGPAALDPDDVARTLGLPLVAVMAGQRRLAEAVDLGLGPVHARRGPLARAARTTLAALVAAPVPVG